MPTSSNDQNNNIKANYSWKLAGGEVNDPLETQNACSLREGSSTAVTSHQTSRTGRWKNSGSSQSAVARMASSAPAARLRADAVGPCRKVAEVELEPGRVLAASPVGQSAVTVRRPPAPPRSPGERQGPDAQPAATAPAPPAAPLPRAGAVAARGRRLVHVSL